MNLIPANGNETDIVNWLKMAFFLAPFFLIFNLIIKEKELKEASYSAKKIRRGYTLLIPYIIVSFTVMLLLILYKKGKL